MVSQPGSPSNSSTVLTSRSVFRESFFCSMPFLRKLMLTDGCHFLTSICIIGRPNRGDLLSGSSMDFRTPTADPVIIGVTVS